MLIETTDNRIFRVKDAGPGLEHVWRGVEQKLDRSFVSCGVYVDKKNAKPTLIRRAGCRVVYPKMIIRRADPKVQS